MADQPDHVLLQRLQNGDRRAIEYLVHRYERVLFNFAYRYVSDRDIAADVCQFTFIQLYTHAATLLAEDSLRPWLFRVARHRSLDELRRQRATPFSQLTGPGDDGDGVSFLEQIPDSTPLPADITEQENLQEILMQAIQSLPPKFRDVVLMRYLGDLNFAEIGNALGIPEATAKTHFHRAKGLLRKALRELHYVSDYDR